MTRRLLVFTLMAALLFPYMPTVQAKPVKSTLRQVASGSVTQANMKISAVPTGSHIDFGSGELVSNGGFASDISGWTNNVTHPFDTLEFSGGKLHAVSNGTQETGAYCNVYSTAFNVTQGQKYLIKFTVTVASGTKPTAQIESTPIGTSRFTGTSFVFTSGVAATVIGVAVSTGSCVFNLYREANQAVDFTLDDVSITPYYLPYQNSEGMYCEVFDSLFRKLGFWIGPAGTGSQSYAYCMGDSLSDNTYEPSLGTLLGPNWTVVERGVNGEGVSEMQARFAADVTTPGNTGDYAIIWGGVNNIVVGTAEADIKSGLQAMYTAAHNEGMIVVAVNITPWKGSAAWDAGKQTVTDSVNAWIASTATDVDYKIDAYALLEDGGTADTLKAIYDSGDHVHLSAAGYNAVATAIFGACAWTHTGGETLGIELITGWSNIGFSTFTSSGKNITQAAVGATGAASPSNALGSTVGGLYRASQSLTLNSGAAPWYYLGDDGGGGGGDLTKAPLSAGSTAYYLTFKTTAKGYLWLNNAGAATDFSFTPSYRQVTAPSATGCLVYSTKGGPTQSFAFKDAAFNYNDSSGYTYKIYKSTVAPVVASGTVTQANFHADLTATNAFVELVGVDLTAYQNGKYMIALYNATGGYGMFGHISSTAPAGETLDSELVDGWTNNVSYPYETWTPGAGSAITQAVNTTGGGIAYKACSIVNLALYKEVATVTKASGTNPVFMVGTSASGANELDFATGTTAGTYKTIPATLTYNNAIIYAASAVDFALSGFSFKKVTDPPSTGARIVSTQGGATRAWTYTSASFSPNDSAGQRYAIIYIGQ